MKRRTAAWDSSLFDWAERLEPNTEAAPEDVPSSPERSPAGEVWGIDAMNLIFQLYHAMPEMTSPDGRPIAVLWGFLRDLLTIRREYRPASIFVAFDLPGGTFRHTFHPEYKANRSPTPEPLLEQIVQIRPLLEELGIAVVAQAGFEADDILATLAETTERAGRRCVIVTNDKDCRQLISPAVRLCALRKKRFHDLDTLREEWGITPSQVVDYLSLVGDAVDNVVGVPMIGPKIARELLIRHGGWEGIQQTLDTVSGERRRENLRGAADLMERNRTLIRLRRDVPCTFDHVAGAHPIAAPTAVETLRRLGLARYISDFTSESPTP